ISGSNFNDILVVSAGSSINQLRGGGGNDIISASGIGGIFTGDAGDDTLIGDVKTDWLFGGAGKDALFGGGMDDTLDGGAGADILDGGAGNDEARYVVALSAVVANLANSKVNAGEAAGDTYVSVENVTGSQFNDTLTGDVNDNHLKGYIGND